jgi:hypothetical protein
MAFKPLHDGRLTASKVISGSNGPHTQCAWEGNLRRETTFVKSSSGGFFPALKRQVLLYPAACTECFALGWPCNGSGGILQVWDAECSL